MKLAYLIVIISLLLGPILTRPNIVTANLIAARCEKYRYLAEYNYEDYPIDPDIVLAVMAQESGCDPTAVSKDGHNTVGLMQIAEKSWTPSEEQLFIPSVNVRTGMRYLYANLMNSGMNPAQSMTRALAAYNCGWTSLNAGKCIPGGGWDYATKVMLFWLPIIRGEIKWPLP